MSTIRQHLPARAVASIAPKWAEEAVARFREAMSLRAQYNRAVSEMQSLSDRSLADLGIYRTDIRRIAREAVYGEG